jgi:hypothetical protein
MEDLLVPIGRRRHAGMVRRGKSIPSPATGWGESATGRGRATPGSNIS